MSIANPIPITVLTGYLGSGKTTLINHILHNTSGLRVAVIVNDMGAVNIDASLLAYGGTVNLGDQSLVPLSNGCICCTLQGDLVRAVAQLVRGNRFDYILIEASGICEPLPIAQTLTVLSDRIGGAILPQICRLDTIATVVDAYRMKSEFLNGETLLHTDGLDEEDITQLLVQQIEFCNVILLNKADMVEAGELQRLEAILHKLQPSANILRANYAKIDLRDILNTHLFNFREACMAPGWVQELERSQNEEAEKEGEADEYGVNSFVYERRQPFCDAKLCKWIEQWPTNVLRCKGVAWIADQNDMMFLFQQAGRQVQLIPSGRWLATGTASDREKAFAQDSRLQKDWHPLYGDRITKLVFIGMHLNQKEIAASLDTCLLEPDALAELFRQDSLSTHS